MKIDVIDNSIFAQVTLTIKLENVHEIRAMVATVNTATKHRIDAHSFKNKCTYTDITAIEIPLWAALEPFKDL